MILYKEKFIALTLGFGGVHDSDTTLFKLT